MSTGWIASLSAGRTGAHGGLVQKFPATQLFVERAMASGARMDLSDAEAVLIASICRKLDGVALAIELAARRVESYGLQQTATLLDQRLTLLWPGPAQRLHASRPCRRHWTGVSGFCPNSSVRFFAARRVRRSLHARRGTGGRDERDP